MITHDCKRTCWSCEITNLKCSWISNLTPQVFLIIIDQGMQTLGYMPVVCKYLWIIVKSTSGKNNGHNLLRISMVVDAWHQRIQNTHGVYWYFTIALKGVCLCPRCRYLGFSHNAIGPPHLTAFVSFWHFENIVFNNTRDMSIDNILSAN